MVYIVVQERNGKQISNNEVVSANYIYQNNKPLRTGTPREAKLDRVRFWGWQLFPVLTHEPGVGLRRRNQHGKMRKIGRGPAGPKAQKK